MNYIYDIYLNLNSVLYDFFEWNKNDKLIHIRKIPIIKINHDDFTKISSNSILVDNEFLCNIYMKTESWSNDKINYCTLFCDDNNIIAIEFNKNGKSIRKSFLQIDEELEILETINKYKERCVNFKVLKYTYPIFKTRKEIVDENFVEKELKSIDFEKLKYIYFECFGKHENNKNIIVRDINMISRSSKIYKNLYNILKLTEEHVKKM